MAKSIDPIERTAELSSVTAKDRRSPAAMSRGGTQHRGSSKERFCSRHRTNRSKEREEEHVQSARNHEEERRTLTLKIGSVYHVMNRTCIHMRAGGPNIYMYRRGGNIQRTPEEI
jgi:hypothetical protein